MALSASNRKIISGLEEQIEHLALTIARIQADCPNLPSWFTDKPVEWYQGALDITEGFMSTVLMANRVYSGFQEVTVKNTQFKVEYTVKRYYMGKVNKVKP